MNEKQIILASSSPRRIEMMKENGINPIIIPPDVSENLPETIGPKDAVLFLALKKALAVEESAIQMGLTNGEIIIAADTVVFLDSIIGKPQNEKEAFKILKDLCGKMHFVMTGVAILKSGKSDREVFYEMTKVFSKVIRMIKSSNTFIQTSLTTKPEVTQFKAPGANMWIILKGIITMSSVFPGNGF